MLFSKIIKKKFDAVLGRYNNDPACYYFSPSDFPGIKSENYDIKNNLNENLKGYFYYYGEFDASKTVIFDHGIGAGHLAYFKEIEMLAKNGYTVFSYDHTGCADSEGSGIYGFAQGVNDLDHVLSALKKDSRFANSTFRLVGHSWGAYSVMNACSLHKEVTHVVSLAGFTSAKSLIEQYLPKFVLKYSDEVMGRERQKNPKYADMDALGTLTKSNAKLLYVQSKDDEKVRYDTAFIPLYKAFSNRADTEFISLDNKNHEPHHTDKAVQAYAEFATEFETLKKKKKLSSKEACEDFKKSQDWDAMTEQDPVIWQKILDFLAK